MQHSLTWALSSLLFSLKIVSLHFQLNLSTPNWDFSFRFRGKRRKKRTKCYPEFDFWVGQQGQDVSELDGYHVDQEGCVCGLGKQFVYEVEEAWIEWLRLLWVPFLFGQFWCLIWYLRLLAIRKVGAYLTLWGFSCSVNVSSR